ncbi:hypothetical protein ABEF93_006564 [Exophiala dermatitidis]
MPSPLLASAMAAIGSLYDNRPDAKVYALTLLEVATKLLRRRDNITNRSRLADLQTVFLLEVLSKYCARRVEVEMSARFRSLLASLDQTRRFLARDSLAVFRTLSKDRSSDDLARAHKFWLEHETRRRILQAATVLDQQQVTMFEQPPTIVQHERSRRPSLDLRCKIPLPCSDELWETSPVEKWEEVASRSGGISNSGATSKDMGDVASGVSSDLDFFQIQVSLTEKPDVPFDRLLLRPGGPSHAHDHARLVFNHQVRELARHTPIRQLLIVSGESWVLGKKLENEAEFQAAKRNLRAWVDTNRESRIAFWYATQLIRSRVEIATPSETEDVTVSFLDTYMLHEPWCLYLAALVCWAYGLSASMRPTETSGGRMSGRAWSTVSEAQSQLSHCSNPQPPTGHPALLEPCEAASSMREYLEATNVDTAEQLLQLDPLAFGQFRGLLETVRLHKIRHYLGGLMNDAERVLYRLVGGRGRLSHF